MISIYKSVDFNNPSKLERLENVEPGCWINVTAPTKQELMLIQKKTNVPMDFLNAAMDDEETSRLEIEDNNILIIVDIPFTEMEDNSLSYDTYPLAIIHTEKEIITICLKNSKVLSDFIEGKVKTFFTFKRSRFILQILYKVATYYLLYLRQIDKKSLMVEKHLHKSLKNKELIQLLSLEKSLVYFSISLKSNEITLEKMLKLEVMQKYTDDQDVLEDVIIENKQAIEMASIYSDILSGTMDAFASIISNNLNVVIKFLTSVTIILSIPTMISNLFAMNIAGIPLATYRYGFWVICGLMAIISGITGIFLYKKNTF
ncbi:Magnesium and cobalt transporter [Clostridium acetobutylicum EA 2018]|uniref:magnesium transporter CorA family protein n=1 Tax=Clostridium acetobutylicum TaxID=1488 RepID=UPI000200A703|nr:magnesium transporter CorA family protein [Clostridium acetobutylicum]ADZ19342.1 Magnesium and cobalt transporter [Clostridium acetobutylicum EA 2018]